jgi:hypothetical protein
MDKPQIKEVAVMASKNNVSALVSGLGLGMKFLQLLMEAIVAQGGYEEMLHQLTTEHGKEILEKVAKLVVSSPWKVPRSLMEKLTAIECRQHTGDDPRAIERESKYHWTYVGLEENFGIPVIYFDNQGFSHPYPNGHPPIPEELYAQLTEEKQKAYPLLVEWQGETHVVVDIVFHDLDKTDDCLSIAPTKFFDLER